jgi:hypothetical protein
MQPAASDFYQTIDRAARLVDDALGTCRAASAGRLPPPHRRLTLDSIVGLEKVQQKLFTARNAPWSQPPAPRNPQLALL